MSFYNMMFGMNPQSDWLLAVLGLRKHDVERFRDAHCSEDGKTISVYTRTGGGNRDDYPNLTMRKLPGWKGSEDDDYDCTYCTDTFDTPAEFVQDVANLSDPLRHGLRAEFMQHLAKTLRREPTESDKAQAAYDAEAAAIKRLDHFMANGHTFVPKNDRACEEALKLAEANGGALRTAWGILPLAIEVKRDFYQWPNARDQADRECMTRVEANYVLRWEIDKPYWEHMQKRFAEKYPLTMAKVAESVAQHLNKAA